MKLILLLCCYGSLLTRAITSSSNSNTNTNNPPLGFYPNIIILFADDFGYGDLESYGHPQSLTPHLDELAQQGTKLTAFYSSAPVCSPSRAALLTGRFQTRTGVYPGVFWPDSVSGLPLTEMTIAELVKSVNNVNVNVNYKTGMVGKWHLGVGGQQATYLPTNQGFDFYTGIPYSHDMPNPPFCFPNQRGCWPTTAIDPWNDVCPDSTSSSNSIHKQMTYDSRLAAEQPDKYLYVDASSRLSDNKPYEQLLSLSAATSDSSLATIISQTETALPLYWNTEIIQQPVNMTMIPDWYTNACKLFIHDAVLVDHQPFLLYMAYHQTHHPQFASARFFNTSQRGMIGDAIREMDYNIGELMHYIQDPALDIAEKTFVFFSSDNGPSLMRESRGGNSGLLKCGKGTTFEGGMREPAIVWMPDFIQAARVTRELASTLDLFPTIADLIDVQMPTDRYYDGYSMFKWLFNMNNNNNEDVNVNVNPNIYYSSSVAVNNYHSLRDQIYYWPKKPNMTFGWQKSLHAVRVNQWKLHWITQGSHCSNSYADVDCRSNNAQTILKRPLLFNLYHDIGEQYPIENISQPYYWNIVQQVNKSWSDIFNTPGLFSESQIDKGTNDSYMPCCHWGCQPWPQCCNCDKIDAYLHKST